MQIISPAKLNLYLRVIGKRPDGYHQIETLFERISLFDTINIEPGTGETSIACSDSTIPTDEKSLLGRTVKEFMENSGEKGCYTIQINKKIPVGAGMGGGSSNAASLLRGLNEITGYPLTDKELVTISMSLGADVPFFLHNCSFGTGKGRGDLIEKVDVKTRLWHVLVTPPFRKSTASIFNKINGFNLTKDIDVDRMVTAFLRGEDLDVLRKNLHNDLQTIALQCFPSLEKVFEELSENGAKGVLLSGSGPTVFGLFCQDDALDACEKVKKVFPAEKGWKVFAVSTY